MEIRIVSDLHIEYSYMANIQLKDQIPRNGTESGQVLVLAGDICQYNMMDMLEEFLAFQAERYCDIIYIAGNHEYYRSTLNDEHIRRVCAKYKNVHFLNNNTVTVDGVNFIGSTLWSDHSRSNYIQRACTSLYMNDFKVIGYGEDVFTIDDATVEFNKNVEYIESMLIKHSGEKNVVITHHAPSAKSIHDRFKGDNINHGFYSDLDDMIRKYQPNLWIHGHMHNAFDYSIGDTRVVCNPRGYPSNVEAMAHGFTPFENLEYNPDLAIII